MTRILFVDDDYITIELAELHLRTQGFYVDISDSIEDAVDKLRLNRYDIVFLDVMFACGNVFGIQETSDGRYTGLRLLESLRTDSTLEVNKNSKVVLITNWREEPQVEYVARKLNATLKRKPLALSEIDHLVEDFPR